MAELDTVIWFKSGAPADNFAALVERISECAGCNNDWSKLLVREHTYASEVFRKEEFTVSKLPSLLSEFQSEAMHYTAYVSFDTWQPSAEGFFKMSLPVYVSAWGDKFGKVFNFDLRLEGNARIAFTDVSPFCVFINPETESALEANTFVEKNLETYLGLIETISVLPHVNKILAFTDLCDYLLHNSNLAYFKNVEVLKSSLVEYVGFLKSGTTEKPFSLDHFNEDYNDLFFHEWRPLEMKKELLQDLFRVLTSEPQKLTSKNLQSVFETNKFDSLTSGESFIVLEYPHLMNAFNDRFFIELLSTVPVQE
jgi:hypothetical protein